MLLYYIRHGDPIYTPDSLTEQGEKQAEALSKRLADVDFDRIYVSTSNRAYLTAKPTLEKCGKEPIMTDWLNENVAGSYFWLVKCGYIKAKNTLRFSTPSQCSASADDGANTSASTA